MKPAKKADPSLREILNSNPNDHTFTLMEMIEGLKYCCQCASGDIADARPDTSRKIYFEDSVITLCDNEQTRFMNGSLLFFGELRGMSFHERFSEARRIYKLDSRLGKIENENLKIAHELLEFVGSATLRNRKGFYKIPPNLIRNFINSIEDEPGASPLL